MGAFRPNARRKTLEQSGQTSLFHDTSYGTVKPSVPPKAAPVVELPSGHPLPPKVIELGDETRREAHVRVTDRSAISADSDELGLSDRERQYYDAVRLHGYTPQGLGVTTGEVSELEGIPVQSLTQPCINLREKGLIEPAGRRTCAASGQSAMAWILRPSDPRDSVNPVVRVHGYYAKAGTTCKTCFHFSGKKESRPFRSCLQKPSVSAESQHWERWPACGKYVDINSNLDDDDE